MFRRGAALAVVVAACGRGDAKPPPAVAHDARAADPWRAGAATPEAEPCARLPFAESLPIAEASGAVLLGDGLLVVSDSGNAGAYVIVDPETGVVRSQGALPLGVGAGDDLEGLAVAPDGLIWAVTSAGYLRAWRRDGDGFALIEGPYPLGKRLRCEADGVNCGANLEGLCLAPVVRDGDDCVGFVASKDDGRLYCLVRKDGRLDSEARLSIAVTDPGALSDCAFDPAGDAVWVGGNLFDGGHVSRVTGWHHLVDAEVVPVGPLGVGNPEVITVGAGGVVYRLSDATTTPSLSARWNCGSR